MKKAIYTAIIGDYDQLQPAGNNPGWDFICFTDQQVNAHNWEVFKVESNTTDVLTARRLKVVGFDELLSDYDLTIWIDGNFMVSHLMDEFIHNYHEGDFTVMKHPGRNCLYQEGMVVADKGKDKPSKVFRQLWKYKTEGYPENNGLLASGILIRNNTERVRDLCNHWWGEIEKHSHRDQLSFNYSCWKTGVTPHYMDYNYFSNNYFEYDTHNRF